MKFSIFNSVKASVGRECTYEEYLRVSTSPLVQTICNKIASTEEKELRSELKKQLPIITWQAYFDGKRLVKEAKPSGLFMVDIDHVDSPFEMYSKQIAKHIKELGIVYVGMTASQHGLRIVAKCLPTLKTLEECQRWLTSNLKVEYDSVCKDFARSSFVVPDSYTYYMDNKAIWMEEPAEGTIYNVEAQTTFEMADSPSGNNAEKKEDATKKEKSKKEEVDQREGLFGGVSDYKGIPLTKIAEAWLEETGGIPSEGFRNIRLYKLALRMRYICNFNEVTMLRVMPNYGLPKEEMETLVKSALSKPKAADLPMDLQMVLNKIDKQVKLGVEEDLTLPEIITDTTNMPPLPPVIRQFVETAPDDFKQAVLLCQLPILGTLGSRLRAKYLDGELHSPSFLVSLEAPQASGKSFMRRLCEYELAAIIEHDEEQRAKEREYENKIKEMKLLNIKVTKENKDEVIGSRPVTLVRYVPATMSITKLLMRLNDAKGLHVFSMAEEIDTVTKAFKRGAFSSYSDLLRVGFDNGRYGQDYASENSFSGNVNVRYNMLTSGTPKAMRRFYPDVEDGLVSRVCFVTLPDQFGKRMPVWQKFTNEQKTIVDRGLVDLNEISIIGDEVQPEHIMKMDWLNKELEKWILSQQSEAVKDEDRTRDIFCRRAAVIGFRAGMLAFFLWHEKATPTIVRSVKRFAVYVANCCLNQHLLRFNIEGNNSNTNPYEKAFNNLNDEFNRKDVEKAMAAAGLDSPVKTVLYKWKLNGLIEDLKVGKDSKNRILVTDFRKVKK